MDGSGRVAAEMPGGAAARGGTLGGSAARPPMARMLLIHAKIAAGGYPNCSSLARTLEVSAKTVQRDVDFMRDQLGLPLEYDRTRHGFHYTEAVSSFPMVQVSHGELVALLIAQKAVEQYRGTPFEGPLRSAFAKLAAGVDGESGISLHELTEAISFRPQGLAADELDCFQVLASAVVARHEVEFSYHPLQGEVTTRCVQPYHLGCLANQWYVIGRDMRREALRTFALSRMDSVRQTGGTFERPENFSVAEMFSGSFSAFEAGKIERVVLRLDAFGARLARERRWHDSQRLKLLPDGGAELSLLVSPAPDLENWILGWGRHAEVLRPKSLRQRIASAVKMMVTCYEGD